MSKTPKLEQFLNNTNQELDNNQIFHHFISSNQQDLKEFEQCKNPQQSLCGAHVPPQSLSFQCFDCAPDPHHMYCASCFQLEFHYNHRAFFKKESSGCCDCGDPSAISNKDSFCKLHKEQVIDIKNEIQKIKPYIREAIFNFLKDSFQIYFLKCEEAMSLQSKINNPFLIQCFHISHIINYQQVYIQLNNHYNIKHTYQAILAANHIQDIIIDFLYWLCQDRTSLALLIAGFLKSNYKDEITYFEQVIHYQELKNMLDFDNDNKFEKLLYVLNIDEKFRLFTQEVFFTRQSDLWKIYEIQTFDGSVIVEEYISAFENFIQKGVFYTKEKNQLQLFENYFKKINNCNEKYKAYSIRAVKFFSMNSQFVSEEFQDIQFTSPKIKELLDMNTKLLNILNTCHLGNIDNYYSMLEFFSLKFQYNYFIKSFNNTLSMLFQNYQTQLLQIEEIASLNPNQFFLTALLQSYSQIKGFSRSDKLYQPLISETQIQLNLLNIDSRQVFNIKQCLTKYLASSQITIIAKQNFINILFYWSYEFIRINKNNKEQYNYLSAFYHNNQIENIQEKDQMKTILRLNYCIYRSGSLIDKFFIILLTYLYQQNEFQSSNQFKMFLQINLKQNEQDLQFNLFNIFERCVHNFISLLYTPFNEQVSKSYFAIGKEQLESYDIAFIKLYFILYQNQALNQMICIIQSRKYFSDFTQNQYFMQIIARIIASDKSFSCVSQALYNQTNLPEGLSFNIYQILSNLFILNHFQEYQEIKSIFEEASFSISNLGMYILNFCELDETINKLKLKSHQQIQEYFHIQSSNLIESSSNQTYFNPLLFLNHQSTAQQIGEHLSTQKKEKYFVKFGNFIEQLKEFGQLKGLNLEFIEFFTQDKNVKLIISEIQPSFNSSIEIKLIERLISIRAYLKYDNKQICESLKLLQMSKEQDQQSIQLILKKFGNAINILEEEVLQDKSLQNAKMNKMKAKFKQKIESFQQNDIVLVDDQISQYQQQYDTCALCRLDLEENQNCCIPILIQANSYLKHFPIYPSDLRNQIMKDELNLLKISIICCKHKFHDKCLIASYSYSKKQKVLPSWFQLQCPVCKSISESRLPINKNKSIEQFDEFNNWVLLQCQNLGIKNYLNQKYGESIEQKLKEIYLSLLVDLLIQLFMDPLEFIRQDKYFVFINILDCLFQISKKITIYSFDFQNQQSILLIIINLIIELLKLNNHQQKSLNDFLQDNQNQIKSKILQFDLPLQIKNQLMKCFALNIEQEQNQIIQVNQYLEQFNKNILINIVKKQITENLGFKFKQFYDRYFNQPCQFCKGFSNASKSSDQFICLLCCQKVCDVECKKLFSKSGNMNIHAQLNHQGNTIFISLKTGQLALLSSPLTCFGYKNLYQNKFGQLIKITNIDTQWEEYYINNKVLTDTAEIIISNSLKQLIKNQELNYNQLDVRGYF